MRGERCAAQLWGGLLVVLAVGANDIFKRAPGDAVAPRHLAVGQSRVVPVEDFGDLRVGEPPRPARCAVGAYRRGRFFVHRVVSFAVARGALSVVGPCGVNDETGYGSG